MSTIFCDFFELILIKNNIIIKMKKRGEEKVKGEILKEMRKNLKLSQKEIALMLNIAQSYVAQIEKDKRSIRPLLSNPVFLSLRNVSDFLSSLQESVQTLYWLYQSCLIHSLGIKMSYLVNILNTSRATSVPIVSLSEAAQMLDKKCESIRRDFKNKKIVIDNIKYDTSILKIINKYNFSFLNMSYFYLEDKYFCSSVSFWSNLFSLDFFSDFNSFRITDHKRVFAILLFCTMFSINHPEIKIYKDSLKFGTIEFFFNTSDLNIFFKKFINKFNFNLSLFSLLTP